jgi:2-haloacid dehalogenase
MAAAAGLEPGSNTGAQDIKSAAVAPSICVFDVNETLLDIEFIAPLFHRLFGDTTVLREWFAQLILYSNVITLSGSYTTFFALGQGVLKMLGSIHGVSIREADIDELRQRMLTMPAHPDVPTGLKRLKDAGFRLMTLTNSPPDPQPAEARRHRRLVRKIVQRRSRAPIQTGPAGVPHGRRGA